jgi:hypothetical protein
VSSERPSVRHRGRRTPRIRDRDPVPEHRLHAQQIASPRLATPAEVVGWMGAVQAQDYLASLWAVGLRMPGATEAIVEAAIEDGSIVRIHALRGTWQYIARDDVRWMLALVGRRLSAGAAARHRQLGLDDATLARGIDLLAAHVRGGRHATRAELATALGGVGIDSSGQRLIHMLAHAELTGVLCSAPRRGKQVTFAAFDERIPAAPALDRVAAAAELARRFVQARAPATVEDFAWWSGLPLGEARPAFAAATPPAAPPRSRRRTPRAYLLPAFDEYLIGYADRSAVLAARDVVKINAGGGMLNAIVVVDGRVAGTWRRTFEKTGVVVTLAPVRALSAAERSAIDDAADRYGAFLGAPVRVVTASASRRPR